MLKNVRMNYDMQVQLEWLPCSFFAGHDFIVSFAAAHVTSYNFYSVRSALNRSHDVSILIPDVYHYDTFYSIPIFRWFPVLYVSFFSTATLISLSSIIPLTVHQLFLQKRRRKSHQTSCLLFGTSCIS